MTNQLLPYSHAQCALPQLYPASSCTTPVVASAWVSFGLAGDSERCSHLPHWEDKPKCGL